MCVGLFRYYCTCALAIEKLVTCGDKSSNMYIHVPHCMHCPVRCMVYAPVSPPGICHHRQGTCVACIKCCFSRKVSPQPRTLWQLAHGNGLRPTTAPINGVVSIFLTNSMYAINYYMFVAQK